jgi:hypothetical protein
MTTDPALNAMIRLRSEIAGRINHHNDEAERAERELGHVDAVLHMMSPDLVLEHIGAKKWPPRTPTARRNNRLRTIVEIMRATPQSLTASAIAERLAERAGEGPLEGVSRAALIRKVESSLHRLRTRGRAVAIPQEVGPQAWRMT